MIQTYNPPNIWRMLFTLSDAYEQSHILLVYGETRPPHSMKQLCMMTEL